ncbi:MAG: hypothetical protein QXL54_04905 [Candidatus Bathyarchaeia archaeon]
MNFEMETPVKPQNGQAAGLTVEGPKEEIFYFVFVCKGSRAAYKQVEEFIRAKTAARLIFQRISKNYLSVSEVTLRPLK